jgi:hypothetical protein
MSNWRPVTYFCRFCRGWYQGAKHPGCKAQGELYVELEEGSCGCGGCKQVWPLASCVRVCPCGHAQRIEYPTDQVRIEKGDEILHQDDEEIYVLTRTGALVIGHKSRGVKFASDPSLCLGIGAGVR